MAVNAIDGTKKKLGELNSTSKSVSSSMTNIWKTFGAGLAGYLSVSSIINFSQASIRAYQEQEAAVKKLDVALGRSSVGLQRYATELQKTTVYSDELTIEAMSLVAAFTTSEEKIKMITKAAAELSAAKGIDLVTATDLLTKSIFTNTNALRRQGIDVEGTRGSVERLESAVGSITELYGGQANAALDTYTGKLAKLNNELNEQQEEIGRNLLPAWVQINKWINTAVKGMVDYGKIIDQYLKTGLLMGVIESEKLDMMKTYSSLKDEVVKLTEEELLAEERKLEALRKQNAEAQLQLTRASNKLATHGIESSGVGVPLEMVTTYYDARAQLSLEFTNQEMLNYAMMEGYASETFGNMAGAFLMFYSISKEKNRALFDIYKGFAIGEAIASTYLAANKALAEVPFPFNIPVMGSIIAMGLANVARIASSQPNGGGGGGGGFTPSVPNNISNTTNNNQRSSNYVITINTQGGWEGDKDKFARELIYYIRKAEGDGG